jgi:hypothetical protein
MILSGPGMANSQFVGFREKRRDHYTDIRHGLRDVQIRPAQKLTSMLGIGQSLLGLAQLRLGIGTRATRFVDSESFRG